MPRPTLTPNAKGFSRLAVHTGIDDNYAALAKRIGVNTSTVSRIMRGQHEPSGRFIAAVLAEFGTSWFHELFDVHGGTAA
ncbi:helix-turn-helix transcriptional regulator [Mycobacterium sp. SVM_VP21]|nr:helix-turn-helix transcriptional regulator [Mycobacterium sp. SVM_VP21]